jgi:hypothetical protein
MAVVKRFYDDGGSNTSPYDTWAKAAPLLETVRAAMAAGDWVWAGNDTIEAIAASTGYNFPGTQVNPSRIVSVQKDTPPGTLLAGATFNVATNQILYFGGNIIMNGLVFNLGTTTGRGQLSLGYYNISGGKSIFENCSIVFIGTASTGVLYLNGDASTHANSNKILLRDSTIKFSHASQTIYFCGECTFDNITIDPAGSAIAQLMGISYAGNVLIQNCNLAACAQALVVFRAVLTTNDLASKFIIRNCKLPANWSGTLVEGGAVTYENIRAEMYNCDSGDTNYRVQINDFYAQLTQETVLVANAGAGDGTNRISWKIATTANTNPIRTFYTPELHAWNDTEGTQRTCTIEIIHNAGALLTDSQIWLEADYSADTGDPLYQKASDRTADLFVTAAANQDVSTKAWDDLVSARVDGHVYALGALIKCASNSGRVFVCTTAGTSTSSEPAGYGTAVDGGTVADGGTCVFTAMYRQKLVVALPASKPANKGFIIGTVKVGVASKTIYVDPNMTVV